MAYPFYPKDLVTLEELTISNMWEVAALDKGELVKHTDPEKELY